MCELNAFVDGYISCALWTLTDENGEPCDWAGESDIDSAALSTLRKDARDFYKANYYLIAADLWRAGHDFWLTRNGYGAGFWDGDWPEHGDELTAASKAYGSCELYLGDDERIYIY